MGEKTLKIFVKGNADIVDATMSRADGGGKLDRGLRELIATRFPEVTIETVAEDSAGFRALRTELESGNSRLVAENPQIVILSLADDVKGLSNYAANPEEAVHAVEADLVASIDALKGVGAHVLIANVSTLDPAQEVFNYHGVEEDPLSLRAHRLDLMLIGVSHYQGISIIDVDRKLAELGGASGVASALDYTVAGCEVVADEIVRVIDDYGFFDDRPLLAQVGAKAGKK